MKFRLQNDPLEVTVSAQLAVCDEQLELRLGGFLYLCISPGGSVRLCTFWRNSPMYDFCIKHKLAIQEIEKTGQFRLQLELQEKK